MAKKQGSGFTTATPDKAGTSWAKTNATVKTTYKTAAGKKGEGCSARKDMVNSKDENF